MKAVKLSCDRCGAARPANRRLCEACRTGHGLCEACSRGGYVGEVRPTRPPDPTAVRPGPDKVAVLESRYLAGEFLWHEGDAK